MVSSSSIRDDDNSTNRQNSNVSSALLHSFFQEATRVMNELNYNGNDDKPKVYLSLSEQRQKLLRVQQDCLSRVVDNFDGVTVQDVQETLLQPLCDSSLEEPLEEMTSAARLAFARLVLQQELLKVNNLPKNNNGTTSTKEEKKIDELLRSDIIEFCGLCKAAVKLQAVKEFLVGNNQKKEEEKKEKEKNKNDGASSSLLLYGMKVPEKKKTNRNKNYNYRLFPPDRLELVQRLYFEALGYDADFATLELRRIMSSADNYNDTELHSIFGNAVADMRMALAQANYNAQQSELNDFEDGGVTRVVSVSHSEQNQDDGVAPQTESMQHQQQQNTMSVSSLEQSLLAKVLQMDNAERQEMLEQAQTAQTKMMMDLKELPTGQERIQYMTQTISQDTQELLLMYKLWMGLLARNNGQAPQMR